MTVLYSETVDCAHGGDGVLLMPPFNRSIRVLVVLAIVAMLPTTASAANKEGSIEIGGNISFINIDPAIFVNNDFTSTLLMGYNFTKRHGIEATYSSFEGRPLSGDPFPIDVDIFRFGYTYNAYPREKIVSFLRAGVGTWIIHPEKSANAPDPLQQSDHRPLIYAGGGVRLFINDTIAIRIDGSIDAIDRDGFFTPDINGTAGVGVVFLLGGHEPVDTE